MTQIAAWAAPYVGLPYRDKGRGPDAWDCWGGVRMVFADVFGLHLPDYGDAYRDGDDWFAIAETVRTGLAAGWDRVDRPEAGDLLVLSIAARPWHCGVMVAPSLFLHWAPNATSCVERIDAPKWTRRIHGFYRWRAIENEGKPCDTCL